MNENALEAKKPEDRERGTAAVDDWIICKSKSRNNQQYYFNTFTGKSVWTLSETNKEKAVIQTCQECPEPTEPASPSTSQTNNVQNLVANPAQSFKEQDFDYKLVPPPTISALYQHTTYLPPVPQISNFSNYPGNPSEIFQNIIWSVPPPNHYPPLFVPPMALQPNTANKTDFMTPATTIPLSERFTQIKEQSEEPIITLSQKLKDFTSFRPIRPNDLRVKLNARRMQRNVSSEHYVKETGMQLLSVPDEDKKEPTTHGNLKIIKDLTQQSSGRAVVETEKESCDEDDQIWLAENKYINEQNSRIDVSPLRDGACDGVNPECWYIMADTNVYYRNLSFLNLLIHSDDECYLLVSKTVLNELTRNANSIFSKANDFLRTQLASGKARTCDEIGTEQNRCPCVDNAELTAGNVGCPVGDDRILKCCLRLAESNYHVILLSHDRLLERKANSSTLIPFYKVDKIKELLASYRKQKDKNNDSREILITINNKTDCDDIPNYLKENVEEEREFTEPNEPYQDAEGNFEQEKVEEYFPLTVNVNAQDLNPQMPRYLPTSPELARKQNCIVNLPLNKPPETAKTVATTETESSTSGTITARPRTIRLNRAGSRCSPTETSKKPLKWRRRPLNKPTCEKVTPKSKTASNSAKFSPKRDNKNLIQEHDRKVCEKVEETIDKNKFSPQDNDDVASSVGNTSCCSKKDCKETSKIVEETSTSGSEVISNSMSSTCSEKPKFNLRNCSSKRPPANTVVPKPMDNTMLYNLQYGCEELVSFFVQIMEDMYTQLLLHMEIPKEDFLPLNLHHATQYVKIMFGKQKEVSGDANNFLDFLNKFQDVRGNLRRDLNPEDYMKMFGCGENLVRSLKRALPGHEDIETSLGRLDHLLNDIKDPKSNESFSFIENKHEDVAHTGDQYDERNLLATETDSQQERLPLEPCSPTDYQATNNVRETKFVCTAQKGALDLHRNRKKQQQIHQSNGDVEKPNAAAVEKNAGDVPKKSGPKISCEFTICPQFEEKFRFHARNADRYPRRGELDEDMDYAEELGEDELDSDLEIDQYREKSIEGHNMYGRVAKDHSGCNENDDQSQAAFIKILMKEIKDTFLYVNSFCQVTYSELQLDNVSDSRRLEILTKANEDYIFLENLLGKLNSILVRESYETESSIKCLTKDSFRGTKLSSYRDVIETCTDQAKLLLDALNSIKDSLL